ncbi:MAG: hypothetical protein GX429_07800 [Bacteroidales bacterium]|nr:hypothetical protein [Bacteroidales bacterium]
MGEKHVYNSERTVAGMGCYNFAFVRRGICFLSFISGSKLLSECFFGLLLTFGVYDLWWFSRRITIS